MMSQAYLFIYLFISNKESRLKIGGDKSSEHVLTDTKSTGRAHDFHACR
jgi:hypothetical protein